MVGKCLYFVIFTVFINEMSTYVECVTNRDNGNVFRDPVKVTRLVKFKSDLYRQLHNLKETNPNTLLEDIVDNIFR